MEDDWVVDSLIGFLQSPLWTNPVSDFIEQECIIFDQQDESESPSQSEVHSDYKTMIGELLDGFTADLGMSSEQLADACVKSRNLRAEHTKLLQPLLASEDFELFKTIMCQKNVDLELQALQLLQKQMGQAPSPYQPGTIEGSQVPKDLQAARMEKEERMLQEALEMSRREYDQEQEKDDELMKLVKQESLRMFHAMSIEESETEKDDQEVEKVIKKTEEESLKMFQSTSKEGDETGRTSEPEEGRLEGEMEAKKDSKVSQMEKRVSKEMQSSVAKESSLGLLKEGSSSPLLRDQEQDHPSLIGLSERAQTESNDGVAGAEAAQLWVQTAKSELNISPSDSSILMQVPDDPHAREKYLRRQRDRLLESKKKARADELKVYNASISTTHAKGRSRSNWQPMATGSYRKLPDDDRKEEGGEKRDKRVTKDEGSEKSGMGIISKTGVLCSVIAKKLKKEETFL